MVIFQDIKVVVSIISIMIIFMSYSFALKPLFMYKSWNVFETEKDGEQICYLLSFPIEKKGNYKERGESYFMVTKKRGSSFNEVIVSSGFLYDSSKMIDVSILKRRFPMLSMEEKALTVDRNDDVEIVRLAKLGAKAYITGYFTNGSYAVDTYSLMGFNEAFSEVEKLCKD